MRMKKVNSNKISIHSPHARGDQIRVNLEKFVIISIHSPHARGDGKLTRYKSNGVAISIHSPHARGDMQLVMRYHRASISIHSPHARGDDAFTTNSGGGGNFNPLPSCEGRHSDLAADKLEFEFQSTPLMRGETL